MVILSQFFIKVGNLGDAIINRYYDDKYLIDTKGIISPDNIQTNNANILGAKSYQATHYRLIHKALNSLNINYGDYEFLDLGAGKGRDHG